MNSPHKYFLVFDLTNNKIGDRKNMDDKWDNLYYYYVLFNNFNWVLSEIESKVKFIPMIYVGIICFLKNVVIFFNIRMRFLATFQTSATVSLCKLWIDLNRVLQRGHILQIQLAVDICVLVVCHFLQYTHGFELFGNLGLKAAWASILILIFQWKILYFIIIHCHYVFLIFLGLGALKFPSVRMKWKCYSKRGHVWIINYNLPYLLYSQLFHNVIVFRTKSLCDNLTYPHFSSPRYKRGFKAMRFFWLFWLRGG